MQEIVLLRVLKKLKAVVRKGSVADVEAAFKRFDADKDKQLDAVELKVALMSLGVDAGAAKHSVFHFVRNLVE